MKESGLWTPRMEKEVWSLEEKVHSKCIQFSTMCHCWPRQAGWFMVHFHWNNFFSGRDEAGYILSIVLYFHNCWPMWSHPPMIIIIIMYVKCKILFKFSETYLSRKSWCDLNLGRWWLVGVDDRKIESPEGFLPGKAQDSRQHGVGHEAAGIPKADFRLEIEVVKRVNW